MDRRAHTNQMSKATELRLPSTIRGVVSIRRMEGAPQSCSLPATGKQRLTKADSTLDRLRPDRPRVAERKRAEATHLLSARMAPRVAVNRSCTRRNERRQLATARHEHAEKMRSRDYRIHPARGKGSTSSLQLPPKSTQRHTCWPREHIPNGRAQVGVGGQRRLKLVPRIRRRGGRRQPASLTKAC
jgi:hypothetical protein